MSASEKATKRGIQGPLIARGIAAASFGFIASYAVAFWVMALIRGTTASQAPVFWYNLLVFVVAIAFFVCVMSLFSRIFVGAPRQNVFFVMRDAMRRIALGDFDVTVPYDAHDKNNLMGEVVSSLNEMAESLKKLEAMRQEFVSDVSHEIQSPLTSIAGFAKALHDEGLGVDQRNHYLDIIEEESKRLSRLSDNLLKLSALDSKVQPVIRGTFRLDEQLRSVILASEPQWLEKRIEVAADLDPLTIDSDEAMLRQVWSNLLHNAIKFTPAGGRLTISAKRAMRDALVTIADSGAGMAAADIPLVFDRFYKADKSRSTEKGTGGSGLGLSIVQKIVTLHEGTVSAESDGIGRGSTFTVRLPLCLRSD